MLYQIIGKSDIEKLKPFIDENISDSGQLDNAMELLYAQVEHLHMHRKC